MSILTYISHRLRNSRIKKLLTTIVQPSNLSWFKPRPPRVYRKRKLPSRFFRPKHIYITSPQPSNLTWQRLRRLKLRSRPNWKFFRPKHIYAFAQVVAAPAAVVFRALRRLRLHSRPLFRFFRPRHVIYAPPHPSNLTWKRLRRLKLHSRPMLRFFRPKHIIFTPAQPSNFAFKALRRLKLHSRPLTRFFRPKRSYPFAAAIAPAVALVFRALRRLRLHSRPALRFFRPRHVLYNPPQPSDLSWFKPRPPKIFRKRKLRWSFFQPEHIIYTPPQPASVISYKRPPRPRIRRAIARYARCFPPRHFMPAFPAVSGVNATLFVTEQGDRIFANAHRNSYIPNPTERGHYISRHAPKPWLGGLGEGPTK